ncbi:hypothetical protein CA13_62820 [Planctomycetes bacterium CA13]|uniref:HAMP domain-containing protein n=1 Tax=Novipirellula herctigrandis TaxID=2527986 RepID=A0A5C5ZD97_9BACT|nr:hypothetical protein CA13_62820 [Planctomycetes bacterium CA13]
MSKRTRILVDPAVQWSIAGRVLIHWTLFLLCLVAINVAVRVFASVVSQPMSEAFASALLAQAPIVIVMLVMLPIFLRDTLALSNRFAGPMYRLRTAFSAVARGEQIKHIKFRTGDFWLEAADDFNVVLDELNSLKEENKALKAENERIQEETVAV